MDNNKQSVEEIDYQDPDKAIADLTEAIRLNPDDAEAYYKRGLMYAQKKDYDQAIEDYTNAIRINPNHAEAYYHRGYAYDWKDDNHAYVALGDYEEAFRLKPPLGAFAINDLRNLITRHLR